MSLQNGEAADRQSKEASISGSSPAAAPAGKVTVTYWYRYGNSPHDNCLHVFPAVLAGMLSTQLAQQDAVRVAFRVHGCRYLPAFCKLDVWSIIKVITIITILITTYMSASQC